MDCGHGWHNENDCEICRPPAIVVAGLRGRISDLEAKIADAVHCLAAENLDITDNDVRIQSALIVLGDQ